MDESRQSDANLMAALREGSSSAMTRLVERWQPRLLAFVYRYIQNEAVARDLTEETFVRLYLSRDRYDSSRSFSTWLFGIASNLCRNQFHWWNRRQETSLEDVPEAVDPRSPADHAGQKEEAAVMARCVRQLPHGLRVSIILYYYEGLSYAEIAEILGCTVRGVESRLYRARRRLGRKLELEDQLPFRQVATARLLDGAKVGSSTR